MVFASCRASCVQTLWCTGILINTHRQNASSNRLVLHTTHPFPIFSIMRWSLVLSAFIAVQSALSFVCVALPVPPLSDGLERRASDVLKLSSKEYRKNAAKHSYAYHVEGLGPNNKLTNKATVKREKLEKAERPVQGKKLLNTKGLQAGTLLRIVMQPCLLRSDCRSCLWSADAQRSLERAWYTLQVRIRAHLAAIPPNHFFIQKYGRKTPEKGQRDPEWSKKYGFHSFFY